jgi:hypothetical protein
MADKSQMSACQQGGSQSGGGGARGVSFRVVSKVQGCKVGVVRFKGCRVHNENTKTPTW